jgi:DNA invertase Pin-like site-specific DNA recombinase
MTDQLTPVIGYGVKSSADEKESVADQQRLIGEAVEKEGGRKLIAMFGEEKASGYRKERGPQLEAAMRTAIEAAGEHGEAELWVFHSSRLARGDGKKGHRSIGKIVHDLLYENVTVRSVTDNEMVSPMLAGIAGVVSHKYSADVATHVTRGAGARKAKGLPMGRVPFGYTLEPQMLDGKPVVHSGYVVNDRVPDRDARLIVDEAFAMVENGATSGDVARALNARGVLTTRGNPWNRENVAGLLRNRNYIGEGGYPALVSPERWQAVQDQLNRVDATARHRRQGGAPGGDDFLLRGIVFCARCGAPLWTRADHGRRYQCRQARRSTGLCDAPPIPADVLERHVLNHLDTFIGSVEGWLRQRATELSVAQRQRAQAIDTKRDALAALDRTRDKFDAEWRRMVDAGNRRAHYALEEVERIDREREHQARVIADEEAVAAEWVAPAMDAALDYYNRIVDVIHGRVRRAEGAEALNRALASVLAGLWVELDVDRDRLLVEFALHDQPAARLPGGVELLPFLRRESLPPASLRYLPLEPRPFEGGTAGSTRFFSVPVSEPR